MRLAFRLVWLVAGSVGACRLEAASVASASHVEAASVASACQMVDGDQIRGSDLAAAAPAFSKLDPALEVGLSPLPGVTRVFHSGDLLRLAKANGIELKGAPADVCFDRVGIAARGPVASLRSAGTGPLAVQRGEKVAVTVTSGGVQLKFESAAESSGRLGETVMIRNPESGGRFAAVVEAPGKVTVKK